MLWFGVVDFFSCTFCTSSRLLRGKMFIWQNFSSGQEICPHRTLKRIIFESALKQSGFGGRLSARRNFSTFVKDKMLIRKSGNTFPLDRKFVLIRRWKGWRGLPSCRNCGPFLCQQPQIGSGGVLSITEKCHKNSEQKDSSIWMHIPYF